MVKTQAAVLSNIFLRASLSTGVIMRVDARCKNRVCSVADGVLASSNERGGDAAACFDGMNKALAAAPSEAPRAEGQILARAPAVSSCKSSFFCHD